MKLSARNALLIISGFLLACVSTPNRVIADTPAYLTSGTESDPAGYGLSAFEFTPSQDLVLTQLGFTFISINTAIDAPHVTLWNASSGLGSLSQMYDTGDLSSYVNGGNNGIPSAPTFVSVGAGINLTAGQTYLISGPAYFVPTYNSTGVTVSPDFSSFSFLQGGGWNGWANTGYTFSSLAAAPSTALPTVVNFQYTVAVPEPSSYLMVGVGLAVVLIGLCRGTSKTVL